MINFKNILDKKYETSFIISKIKDKSKEIGVYGIKNFETKEYFNDIIQEGMKSLKKDYKYCSSVHFNLLCKYPSLLVDEEEDNTIDLHDAFPLDFHLIENLQLLDNDTKYPLAFYIEFCDENNISKCSFERNIYLDKFDYMKKSIKIKITSNINFVKDILITATGYYITDLYLKKINNLSL